MVEKNGGMEQILLTGDRASSEGFSEPVKRAFPVPVFVSSPIGLAKLAEPRFASVVGLVVAAEELEKKTPLLRREKGILADMKEKAVSFLNEYF